MAELVRYTLDGGGEILIEVEEEDSGFARAGRAEQTIGTARKSFEQALEQVRDASSAALGQFRSMARQPDEIEVRFGVRFAAEAGAVIAKTGLSGQLEVTLRWTREKAGARSSTEPLFAADGGEVR